jgi:hypothetical protein
MKMMVSAHLVQHNVSVLSSCLLPTEAKAKAKAKGKGKAFAEAFALAKASSISKCG